jgi:hypothetical protein
MKSTTSTATVGTQAGENVAQQQLHITPDEAIAVVKAFHRLQRMEHLLDVAMPMDVRRHLTAVIDRAGLSALVA